MTEPLPSLDLRLTPDWLKESEPANRYADYEGDAQQDRHQRGRRDRRDERPRRSIPPTDRNRREQADRKPLRATGPFRTRRARRARSNASPKAAVRRRYGTIDRVFNGGKNRPRVLRSSRPPSRSTFSLRNALFLRSSSRSSWG